jgi:hypothetical protein
MEAAILFCVLMSTAIELVQAQSKEKGARRALFQIHLSHVVHMLNFHFTTKQPCDEVLPFAYY